MFAGTRNLGPPAGRLPQPRADVLASLYDWEHDAFQDDVTLYAELARRTGGPALELACGTGRVLRGLVRAGLQVVGVDSDPAMLARARARLRDTAGAVSLVQGDLADPVPAGPFALVVLALDALGLVRHRAGQLALLRGIERQLAPGGLVVLDVVHAAALAGQIEGVPILLKRGSHEELGAQVTKWMVRQVHPSVEEMTLHSFYDVVWRDETFSRFAADLVLRYFSRNEVELLLELAGLTVEAVYGDYELGLLADESERMLFVAGRSRPG